MKEYIFHSFTIGDVDDPAIYASFPLGEFMSTSQGQWIKEHCPDPQYKCVSDPEHWGFKVIVFGPLEEKAAVEYMLRWSNK